MRPPIKLVALIISLSVSFLAQVHTGEYVSVAFEVDGKASPCRDFAVDLTLNGKSFKPIQAGHRFEAPVAFKKQPNEWGDTEKFDVTFKCGGRAFAFNGLHPAFVRAGDWRLGIAHPLYALKEHGYTHAFERGALLIYLVFEGEPGVIVSVTEPDPPAGMSDDLQREQADAMGKRARDIAYELAVFQVDYDNNRNYLLSVLSSCLMPGKNSPEDEECDGDLLNFLSNLYWRGDDALLAVLLRLADKRTDLVDDVGDFYADLLERRGKVMVDAMQQLPEGKQSLICKLAFDNDLHLDGPKLSRVQAFLREENNAVASRCLDALKNEVTKSAH